MDIWEFEKQWVDDFGVGYKSVEQVCRNVARDVCCAWNRWDEEEDLFMFSQETFLVMYDYLLTIYDPEKGEFLDLLYRILKRKAHNELRRKMYWSTPLGAFPEGVIRTTPEDILVEQEIRKRITGEDEMKRIIITLLQAKMTLDTIAGELNALGYRTARGQVWSKQRVSEVVRDMRDKYPQIENNLK